MPVAELYNKQLMNATKKEISNGIKTLYEEEVPIHAVIQKVVDKVDTEFFQQVDTNPEYAKKAAGMTYDQNHDVRHAAVRFALPEEMEFYTRCMNLMNLFPIGMYDLTGEGTPVKSIVYRPISEEDIKEDGFRSFTSMADPEAPTNYRNEAQKQMVYGLMEKRRERHFKGEGCFTNRLFELVAKGETEGFTEVERKEFITEMVNIYRLNKVTAVNKQTYEELKALDATLADIFGPELNLNHTTPHTKDNEKVHRLASEEINPLTGEKLVMNGTVYGPKGVFILLEQSSCKAIDNELETTDGQKVKLKTRFCEFETRGQAVTRTGREIYDTVLAGIMSEVNHYKKLKKDEILHSGREYEGKLRDEAEAEAGKLYSKLAHERFPAAYPKTDEEMALQGMVYNKYEIDHDALAKADKTKIQHILDNIEKTQLKFTDDESHNQRVMAQEMNPLMEKLVEAGVAKRILIIYEDFLPASASGIFGSNKDKDGETKKTTDEILKYFKETLGVIDFYDLYENVQAKYMKNALADLTKAGLNVNKVATNDVTRALDGAIYAGDPDRLAENHRKNIIPNLARRHEEGVKKYLGGVTTEVNGDNREINSDEINRIKA